MPVTPACNQRFDQRFHTRQDIYQCFLNCQAALATSRSQTQSAIVSISQLIEPIDPLIVFEQFAPSNPCNFYFEKREFRSAVNQNFAIAALGALAQFSGEGAFRFRAAKEFVQSTAAQINRFGETAAAWGGPHFFANFTFFDRPSQTADFAAATVFLPKWQIAQTQHQSSFVANVRLAPDSHVDRLVDEVWQMLQTIRSIRYGCLHPTRSYKPWLHQADVTDGASFEAAVQSTLAAIAAGKFHKAVLAQAVDVTSPMPFQIAHSLANLRTRYPDCYVFATSNGQGQSFIGASPERLVSVQHQQLATDALAGSAPRGLTACEDARLANALLNSSKEIHEHQFVVDFITRELRNLGMEPQPDRCRLLQLSNIQHLHTPIAAQVPADVHVLDIVAQLHPTPAVAGLPRAAACQQICQQEAFERSLYAAPIGWIDADGNGEFAVGIRSALLNGCQARLFAGAGIVAGSQPDRELAEVRLKLQALLAALV